jgi:hypothetical protein
MPVRHQQERRNHGKPHRLRQDFAARQHGHGIADQSDERKRAHAPECDAVIGGLAFLPLQSDQKRQEQHDQDLCPLGRQPGYIVHRVSGSVGI